MTKTHNNYKKLRLDTKYMYIYLYLKRVLSHQHEHLQNNTAL